MSGNELDQIMKYGYRLTCRQASQLISRSLDQPLPFMTRMKLRFHLLICDACTRFNRQLQQIRDSVQWMRRRMEDDRSIVLPAEAKARIASKVSSKIANQ